MTDAIERYVEKLKGGVSSTDRAAHRHLLRAIRDVEKALHVLTRMYPSREVEQEAQAALEAFQYGVINRLNYPLALVAEKDNA